MMVRMADGRDMLMRTGDVFAVGAGHDACVVGTEPYSSLHFMGAEEYAARRSSSALGDIDGRCRGRGIPIA